MFAGLKAGGYDIVNSATFIKGGNEYVVGEGIKCFIKELVIDKDSKLRTTTSAIIDHIMEENEVYSIIEDTYNVGIERAVRKSRDGSVLMPIIPFESVKNKPDAICRILESYYDTELLLPPMPPLFENVFKCDDREAICNEYEKVGIYVMEVEGYYVSIRDFLKNDRTNFVL